MDCVAFYGRGLHGGALCSVRLMRRPGPLVFAHGPGAAPIAELCVVRTDRGVCVEAPRIGLKVDLVEHLCAALAGLGVRRDLAVAVIGGEVPLLDGGARELAAALQALELPREPAPLRVARAGEIKVEDAVYRFAPAAGPRLEVEVCFPGVGTEHASYEDDAQRFMREIAPARTFGYAREAEELRAQGRARHVDPSAVLVLGPDGESLLASAPRAPGELARHKLLDLMGDLFLHGGPPRGLISATRPGHAATHRAVREALDRGLLCSD